MSKAFDEIHSICTENEWELIVVRWPMFPARGDWDDAPLKPEYERMKDFFAERSVSIVDVEEMLRPLGPPGAFRIKPDDAHPNELAHAKVAEALDHRISGK